MFAVFKYINVIVHVLYFVIAVPRMTYRRSAPGTRKVHRCLVCNMVFHARQSLRYHMYSHKGKYPFTCEVCNKGFTRPSSWHQHINYRHKNKRIYCNICNKEFSSLSCLRRHKKESCASDEVSNVFPCKICGKQYRSRRRINMHMAVHDGTLRKYCSECGASFTRQYGLNNHIKLVHSNNKPNQIKTHAEVIKAVQRSRICRHCGDEFKSPFHMKCHVDAVHLRKQDKCSLCGMMFSCRQNLDRHMRYSCQKQRQKRILSCKFCGKHCSVPSSLVRHMRLFHKELLDNEVTTCAHHCKWCDETFIELSLLRGHQKSDHPHADIEKNPHADIEENAHVHADIEENGHPHADIEENGHPRDDIEENGHPHADIEENGHPRSDVEENVQIHDHKYTGKDDAIDGVATGHKELSFVPKKENKESIMDDAGAQVEKPGVVTVMSNRVPCDLCGMLLTKDCMKRHQMYSCKSQTQKCIVYCTICGKQLVNMSSLKRHMYIHEAKKCKKCEISFDKKYDLVMHNINFHSENDEDHKDGERLSSGQLDSRAHCPVMSSRSSRVRVFKNASSSQKRNTPAIKQPGENRKAAYGGGKHDHVDVKRQYPCGVCKKVYDSEGTLSEHQDQEHVTSAAHDEEVVWSTHRAGTKCDTPVARNKRVNPKYSCRLVPKQNSDAKWIPQVTYSCDVCGETYSTQASLSRHQRQEHTRPTVIEDVSRKGMTSRKRKHNLTTVTVEPAVKPVSIKQEVTPGTVEQGLKPVPQKQVVKPVPQEQGMKPVPLEQGVKPVPQEQGVKPVPQEQGLKPVPLNVDANECYVCTFKLCDKTCKSQISLLGHSRLHFYQCEECGIRCGSKISLRSHLQHVHSSTQQ